MKPKQIILTIVLTTVLILFCVSRVYANDTYKYVCTDSGITYYADISNYEFRQNILKFTIYTENNNDDVKAFADIYADLDKDEYSIIRVKGIMASGLICESECAENVRKIKHPSPISLCIQTIKNNRKSEKA